MNKKRATALILAATLLAAGTLTSCSKKTKEPPKEKRTNVFTSTDIPFPEDVQYVNRTDYRDGYFYYTFTQDYTITRNENGEEVERRKGYYWDDNTGDIVAEEPVVMPREEETAAETTEEVVTDSDGDGIADADTTTDDSTISTQDDIDTPIEVVPGGSDDQKSTLPDGWYYDYINVSYVGQLNIETGETVTAELPSSNDGLGYMRNFAIAPGGVVNMLYSNYTYDELTQTSTQTYTIVQFDIATSKQTNTIDLATAFKASGIDTSLKYLGNYYISSSGDNYFVLDDTVMILNSDFTYKSNFTVEDGGINNIIIDGESVYMTCWSNGNYVIKKSSNGQVTDLNSDTVKKELVNVYNYLGAADGKLYYSDSTGVSMYDTNTDTVSEVMNYINSDINPSNAGRMTLLPDGSFITVNTDWSTETPKTSLQKLTKVPDELLEEEVIVRLGSIYSNYQLLESIIRYNRQNNGIRISMITYDKYNNAENEYTGATKQLNNEIITGSLPDIICLDNSLPIDSYFSKGIFTDLNKFIDSEENGLDRSKLMTNVLEASSYKGKLYSMILSYSVRTLYAKSKFVGDNVGWTFDKMMETINSMPEGMQAFFGESRDRIIDNFFSNSMDSFIDWETGDTKFESQAFIDFIKFLATCPEKDYWSEYYDSLGDNYVYDEDKEREMSQTYELRFYNDKSLLDFGYVSAFSSVMYELNTFATKEVTAIGYPADSGSGAVIYPSVELAISDKSLAKDQAWDIIKFIMNDEKFIENTNYTFSINKDLMDKSASTAGDNYNNYYRRDDDFSWYKNAGYSEDYIEYLKNSRQDYDQAVIDKMYETIKNSTKVARTDSDLVAIINEELSGFFGGTKTAEDTARVIASRVKIYISEHS